MEDQNKEDNIIDLQQKVEEKQQTSSIPTHINGKCANCGYKLSLPFPMMPIFNHQVASSVVIPHSKGIICLKCGVYHNIAIMEFNVALAIVPMERLENNNEESLIIPFRGKIPTT